jgi:hypothetical protein
MVAGIGIGVMAALACFVCFLKYVDGSLTSGYKRADRSGNTIENNL